MSKRKKKLTRRQYDRMTTRCQRFVNLTYFYRRGTWEDKSDRYGFLAPVPMAKRGETVRLANLAPQHWQILCIVYFRDPWGKEYREHAWVRTNQRLAAWLPMTDEQGEPIRDENGDVLYEDQLSPLIEPTLRAAEDGGNARQIIDRAVVLRPWSKAWPSIAPTLRRLREPLELSEEEIQALTLEEEDDAA